MKLYAIFIDASEHSFSLQSDLKTEKGYIVRAMKYPAIHAKKIEFIKCSEEKFYGTHPYKIINL